MQLAGQPSWGQQVWISIFGIQYGVLETTDGYPTTEDPKGAADLSKHPLRAGMAQTAVVILDQKSSGWMTRMEDDGMNCSMF